jgi:Flp pilus assembly protein TadG
MFGVLALPLLMMIGLAIDFSFYVQAESQLNLAADTAALHAVRVASQTYSNGQSTAAEIEQAGQVAGQQWFSAQLGTFNDGTVTPSVSVTYSATPSAFTAVVTYSGSYKTIFSALFNVSTFHLSGSSTTTITNSYDEIVMLLDNSSSMLIGATLSDIVALEEATPCSTQGATNGQSMPNYSWTYTKVPGTSVFYGYGSSDTAPPAAVKGTVNGNCDPAYSGIDGDYSACFYVPQLANNLSPSDSYTCKNGGGRPATVNGVYYPHMPNAPCAFACHNDPNNNDYYALARSLQPSIQLRLDVVQQAAANVVSTLLTDESAPNQFRVGIYQFTSGLQQVYPTSGNGEAGTDLVTAQSDAAALKNTPNLSGNSGNTNFPAAMRALNDIVTSAGDGVTPSSPLKNLFIVTDGMENESSVTMGPMTSATNEQLCSLFWEKGFTVYVLYTPYYPLPNPYYLNYTKVNAEPTNSSPDVAALKACARYPGNFFEASDPTAINTAMQAMVAAALNLPGRFSQ